MDKSMTVKQLAELIGVSDTAVINWEIRGKMPEEGRLEKVKEFLEGRLDNVLYENSR